MGGSRKSGLSSISGGSGNVIECMEHCVIDSVSIEKKIPVTCWMKLIAAGRSDCVELMSTYWVGCL